MSDRTRPKYLQTLADFAAATRIEDLSPEARERGRWIIADCIPVVAAGMQEPEMKALAAKHLASAAAGNASVIGAGRRAAPLDAALLNGTAGTWLELRRFGNGPTSREEFMRFLRWVQEASLRFDGRAYRTMLRNDAYWFSRLGLYQERADNTARILDVKFHLLLPTNERVGGPLDYFQWAAILRSVSALTAYHWVYKESVKPWSIADLLILKDEMPRSLASCYGNLVQNLDYISQAYGRQGPAQRQARAIRTRLQNSRMEEIFQQGLHEFIGEFISSNNRLGTAITEQYLM